MISTVDRKGRLAIPPQPIPKQAPDERVSNWNEVYLGFSLGAAAREANRCIQCPAAPCVKACPLGNDIPGALAELESGNPVAAARRFRLTSPMPEVCGRLCPQERLCEGACVVGKRSRPVAIGKLEAFSADFEYTHAGRREPDAARPSGRRVAVIGSGPAGLVAAEELTLRGHAVEVFDRWPQPGGLLAYGIPAFKLPKDKVWRHVSRLERMGVRFSAGVEVTDATVRGWLEGRFNAIFVSHGASLGRRLGIPGEDLDGIHLATPFLSRLNLPPELLPLDLQHGFQLGRRVIVIGGGDTAMDCARSALRAGATDVFCVYRRSEAEMPGRLEERKNADEEGVRFHYLAAPVALLGDAQGRVRGVRFQKVELGPPDASGRARPQPVEGSDFELAADTVVVAAGYEVDPRPVSGLVGVSLSQGQTIGADMSGRTGNPAVFAAGDNVRGADLVVTALADAKRAAVSIDRYLLELS